MTGIPISDALLAAIGLHRNLAGVKDSTGDELELARLSQHFSAGAYLVGSDKLVAAAYAAGAKGSITAAASVVPDLVASIKSKPVQQGKLNTIRGLLEKFGLGPSVKAILRKMRVSNRTQAAVWASRCTSTRRTNSSSDIVDAHMRTRA